MERTSEKTMTALLENILAVIKGDPPAAGALWSSGCYRLCAWFWRWASAGRVNPVLTFTVGAMSFMHSAFAAKTLREACVGFMDGSTMFLSFSYVEQYFAATQQAKTMAMLKELLELTRPIEATAGTSSDGRLGLDDAQVRRLQQVDMRLAAGWLRWLVRVESCTVASGTAVLVATPIITGTLTFSSWPPPVQGSAYWWGMLTLQVMSSFAAGASLIAVMAFVLAAVCSSAALARAVATQTKHCRTEACVARAVAAHQAVLVVSAAASRHVNAVLLPMVYGYLAVSLVGTFNLAGGRIDPYAAVVVPACLLFLFFFAVIGDLLDTSLQRVGEQAARVDVAWFQSSPVSGAVSWRAARRLLLPMMVRCRRPGSASVRVAWVGPLRLPSFMRVMKRWYSSLQMMRSVQ